LAAFRSPFETAGHTLELRELPRGWWGRLRTGSDLGSADLVIVQRRPPPAGPLPPLRRAGRRRGRRTVPTPPAAGPRPPRGLWRWFLDVRAVWGGWGRRFGRPFWSSRGIVTSPNRPPATPFRRTFA